MKTHHWLALSLAIASAISPCPLGLCSLAPVDGGGCPKTPPRHDMDCPPVVCLIGSATAAIAPSEPESGRCTGAAGNPELAAMPRHLTLPFTGAPIQRANGRNLYARLQTLRI